MKKGENDLLRLNHILNALQIIADNTKSISDYEFYQSDLHKYAVLKQIEIIGEAANFLDESFRNNHPEIPWSDLIGARNVYVHGYFKIDWTIVWEFVLNESDDLKNKIEEIRNKLT